jgi:hypothetical protein
MAKYKLKNKSDKRVEYEDSEGNTAAMHPKEEAFVNYAPKQKNESIEVEEIKQEVKLDRYPNTGNFNWDNKKGTKNPVLG